MTIGGVSSRKKAEIKKYQSRNLNIKKEKSPYRKSSIEACLTLPPGCVHLSVTGSRFETTISFDGMIIYKLQKNNRMQFENQIPITRRLPIQSIDCGTRVIKFSKISKNHSDRKEKKKKKKKKKISNLERCSGSAQLRKGSSGAFRASPSRATPRRP
jgi:hypothetical protein